MMNCMEDNVPSRKITFSQTEGSSKKGGPRLKWLDSVLKSLECMVEESTRQRPVVIKDAKANKGL